MSKIPKIKNYCNTINNNYNIKTTIIFKINIKLKNYKI